MKEMKEKIPRNEKGQFIKGYISPKRKVSDENIVRLYQHRQYSIQKMSKVLNLAESTIRVRLKKLGYKLINKGQFGKDKNKKGNLRHGIYKTIKQYRNLNHCCEYCNWEYGTDIHHILPLSKGGTNDFNNLISLCPNHHRLADKELLIIIKSENGIVFNDLTKQKIRMESD